MDMKEDMKKYWEFNRHEFLRMLDQVPDDKLDFKPGGDAGSVLDIVTHVAGSEQWFTHFVETGEMPMPPPPLGETICCKDSARAALAQAREQSLAALDRATPEKLAEVNQMPWGHKLSIAEMLWYLGTHEAWHGGQIGYITLLLGITDF